MSQISLIIQALKKSLKQQGKTYQDVAKELGLSEASIKRMFASQEISLSRVEAICNMLEIQMTDLLQYVLEQRQQIDQLSLEQEKEIISDRKFCLVTVCVINHWRFEDLLRFYTINEHELIQYLAKLDQLKIIELLPKNKIKLLISPNFQWLRNGPIQQFFQKYLLEDYIHSNFQLDNEETIFQFGMLTKESSILLKKRIRSLANEFKAMNEADSREPIEKRFGQICFVMNKPWASSIFNDLIKPEIKKQLAGL